MNRPATAAVLLTFALPLACVGDDSPTDTSNDDSDDVGLGETEATAVIDGEPFSATLVTITALDSLDTAEWMSVILSGFPDDRRYLYFELHDMRTGEHEPGVNLNLGYGTPDNAYQWTTSWGDDVVGTGSLELTTLSNERIAGTFEFEGVYWDGTESPAEADRVLVTNGEFDVAVEGGVAVQPAVRRPAPKR